MSKKKNDGNEDIFRLISEGVGGELLDDRDKSAWGYIDTGILGLNFILSGSFLKGIPGGCCVECYGGSSSGKTLIGTNFLRGGQSANGVAAMIDAEQTLSKDFAVKASHVDPKKFIILNDCSTLEQSFNKIHKIIRTVRQDAKIPLERPLVLTYDSIACSPSEREFAETELDLESVSKAQLKEAGGGAERPGERAKICSKELRKLPPVLIENNATILFINQERQKIGVLYGPSTTTAGGGMALEYYCSLRIKMSGSKHIKDQSGKIIGINVNIKCTKNKCHRPFGEVNSLRLFFDKGIDPFGGLLEILLQEGRIEAKSAGNYKVCEPFAGGKEITFKSSKERNDVPSNILLECPALVDATSPEQIQFYIDMFGGALLEENKDIVEEKMQNEEM